MKFKEIEPKRNSVAPELDATPYVLSEEEQKAIQGGKTKCNIYHNCGEKGQRSCQGGYSNDSIECVTERRWRMELSEFVE